MNIRIIWEAETLDQIHFKLIIISEIRSKVVFHFLKNKICPKALTLNTQMSGLRILTLGNPIYIKPGTLIIHKMHLRGLVLWHSK